ncbi:MAG TPA: outer membrane lipoprotein carrier protein LolA [Bacteroidota bacterium]|nr:outer membrane lipoprotein carrier protein LolA [Bacteroidota bacterium]
MGPRVLIIFALCGWMLLPSAPALPAGDAAELVSKLRKKYDRIDDLSLSFLQTTVFSVSKARQTSEGGLSLAKENRYRITFDDRVIVSDGTTVWSWSKANAQVIIDRFRDDPNSLTPERLLVRIPSEYASVILGKERVGKVEATILKMTPASAGRPVRWFKIWVDEEKLVILKLRVLDLAENEITYELRDIAMNRDVPDTTFRFTIPPGAEVLDLR